MTIMLKNQKITNDTVFIIAEIGNNHNGSYQRAIDMIEKAAEAGASCVKFQMRHLNEVYRKNSLAKSGEDLGTEYIIDLLSRFELSAQEHEDLASYCSKRGILYLCTPWDIKSVDLLEEFGVSAYKIASADLTNIPLIERIISTQKPIILSTGMSSEEEIEKTVCLLKENKCQFVVLHCNSTYPAPLEDINLGFLHKLKTKHNYIGYSGHERGIHVSIAAVALGACVIERHVTLDRKMEGPDHAASLTFEEFREMVDGIGQVKKALGKQMSRKLSQGEMINRENLGKSLIAKKDLAKGTVLLAEHIDVKSPGQGLSPQYLEQLVGQKLKRDIKMEDFFFPLDMGVHASSPKNYKFSRKWGIPVRYHDFKKFSKLAKPDLYEFHFSYSDLELNPEHFLTVDKNTEFVVHAPELFSNSHLLDLASSDKTYRDRSIEEMQKVIDITEKLKSFFPKTISPMIVTNIGGFSMDAPIEKKSIEKFYERFFRSLNSLNMRSTQIIPQTMAPFPWHFGGQRFQNLFVKIDEITHWCDKYDIKMCFDVSHSKLCCNYYETNFNDFCERISPFVSHIHLGDALGNNGEGLQIGEGEIDFEILGNILKKYAPNASFIPEIWQGHKMDGDGFWKALERLEPHI